MQFENKSCEEVLRLLDSYISNELLTETNLDILDHLDRCAACTAALDSRVHARASLRVAVQRETAPPELLESIRSALPRRSSSLTGAIGERWAMAAVILMGVLLAGVGVWYVQPRSPGSAETERILDMGLAAYQHCPSEPGFESLGWEYDGLVEAIAEEKPSNYEIAAAHRCMFDGRLFVNVVLQENNERVFFVVTEKENEQFSGRERSIALEASGVPVYNRAIDNRQVAGFETGRHLAFVISDLGTDASLKIASSIAALYAPSVRSTQKEARNGH